MKFTISGNVFGEELRKVSQALSAQVPNAIYAGVHVDAKSDQLILTASNGALTMKSRVLTKNQDAKLNIAEQGDVVIPAKLLTNIIRTMQNQMVSISTDAKHHITNVESSASHLKLNTIAGDQYPKIQKPDMKHMLQLPGEQLKQVVNQLIIDAAPKSDSSKTPELCSIHTVADNGTLTFTASDGHRMGTRAISIPDKKVQFELNIPATTMKKVARSIKGNDEAGLAYSGQQIWFGFGNMSIYSVLYTPNFPDMSAAKDVFKNVSLTVQVSTADLATALKRALIVASSSSSATATWAIDPDNQKSTISATSSSVGTISDEIKPTAVSGDAMSISFNPSYVLDAIEATDTDEVKFSFTASNKTFAVQPVIDPKKAPKNESVLLQEMAPVRVYDQK